MNAFAWTIGVAAFLLFQVQPILARFILPWFGGGAAVWTVCLLFFQAFLLAGYAYAHVSNRWLAPRTQAVVHLAIVVLSLPLLPAVPAAGWQPTTVVDPTWRIFLLLTATIGLPYLTLAATAPLVQGWFSLVHPSQSPYRLYAISNAGSLAALVTYPFFFEPIFANGSLAILWAVGFAAYATLLAVSAAALWRPSAASDAVASPVGAGHGSAATDDGPGLRFGTMALWLALSACGSALLMGLTNTLCQDLAAMPFLWVLPLALYLLTFIICFERPAWYHRHAFALLLVPVAALLCWQPTRGDRPLGELVAVYGGSLFVACMVCHGELHRLRPAARRQSAFYLLIALGGALGGLFVAVAAPRLFTSYSEVAVAICLLGCLLAAIHHGERTALAIAGLHWPKWPAIGGCTTALAAAFLMVSWRGSDGVLARSRNFYGVLRVEDVCPDDAALHGRRLMHGTTDHGAQFLAADKARLALTYYHPDSGVGLALQHLPAQSDRRIGVVGLGAGTLASYGRPGDTFRFYEIDPAMEGIARRWFTYLDDSAARIEIVTGDGRLALEREESQGFDLLVLDAFASDSTPVHLLTLEAFATYLRHLRPSGVIAIHVSSRHLDLGRVTLGAVQHFTRHGTALALGFVPWNATPLPPGLASSVWVLIGRDEAFFTQPPVAGRCRRPPLLEPMIWTDEHASLWSVLRE